MNRLLALLFICTMLLSICLTGCTSVAGAAPTTTKAPVSGYSDIEDDPEDRPQLPEGLTLVNGVPQIKVYDVAAKSVRKMDLESYVEGVLAGEMKNDWPMEALKAQAILARTFVLKFISTKDSKYEGADISTDVAEAQAYNSDAVNDRIRAAVAQTRGLVMSDDGELPHAWFHAHSGGMTELPSIALDYTAGDPDYLEPVRVTESDKAPDDVEHWTADFSKDAIRKACHDSGVEVSRIDRIEIGKTGKSGRAAELLIDGKSVSAPTLRLNLDASRLKSTKISDITIDGDTVKFTGSGFGHGVGMSQWAAYALAERGRNANDIIDEFFDDIDIVRMWK